MPYFGQLENRRVKPWVGRSAQIILSVILFILAGALLENATVILTYAAATGSASSFVQAAATSAHGSPSSLSLAFPANTNAGDLLLVAFDYNTGVTPTAVSDSQGNVFTTVGNQLNSRGGASSRVYYAKNIKGGADTVKVTLSAGSSYLELYLAEYSGINPTNPIDAQAGASGSSSAVSSGNATTTAAGDIIYGHCLADAACTAGSGFTARSTLDSNLIEDKVAGSAGSYAATGTANSGWTMQMVALKPTAVAPPVVTSASTASGTIGSAFSYQITASNAPTSYGATGLPAGLSVNSGTGMISGTPTSAGTSSITLTATNAGGTGSAALTLTVAASVAAAYVQAAATSAQGSPGSLSLAFPANTKAGDLLLVAFDYNTGVTPTAVSDSQGNVFTAVGNQLNSPGGASSRVYYASNIKGGADTVKVTLSASSSYLELYLAEYSGINPTNPIDTQVGASGSSATVSSGNATTTAAGDIIYGHCLADSACTAGSGFTARSTLDSNLIEDKVAGNAGSYAATGTSNSGWTMQMVALKPASSGTPTAPVASLSPASLTFVSQAVGATSAAQTITLNNTGNAALTITGIALSGTNAGDFAQTNTCASSVAAGANCTISVTFKPTASGTRAAAVSVTDNAAGSPQSVSLSGTGTATAPVASLSPASLTFASQAVGATSAAQTITLNNTGNAALTITGIALSGTNAGDFAQTNTCASSVAAGANCTISVTFKPTASGTRAAAVSVTDNAAGSPQSVSLSGTGTATAPVASLSPSSLTFASQAVGSTSAAQTITLSNTGNAALTLTSIALTGTNAGDFAQTNTCASSVAAGANCTISVTFKPTASGTRAAAVSVTDNATGSPQSVSLSGTGTATAPVASLSPTSLTFASQAVGSTSTAQTITLSNTGNAALTISGIALTGTNAGDFAQTNTCASSVAAGANCTISVTFKPTASGTRTAAVSVTDNATGSPQSASLSGTGASAGATVSVSPSSVAFGNESVDMTSSSQTVTVTNTGSVALSITGITLTGADTADFSENSTCGSSVAAGGNCTIAILFAPAASGSRTAALNVADNATGSPQTVSLSGTGTHDVILSWTASGSSGCSGYNIYRGTAPGGESSTPLNSTPVDATVFTDQNVQAGQIYYYVVTAVAGSTQSGDSNEASATVPSP